MERTPGPDDYLLIDRLREDASAGRMDLSSILSEATHAARYFTDATGAALALWSQGVVICRARSGDTAPPLGAKLDVDAGISGECLRSGRSQRCNDSLTDPRVNAEVCTEMGIRSLAAVPLRGGQGVIGILEVFSDKPNAFSDAHITLLKKLAKIAATGREQSVAPVAARPAATAVPEPKLGPTAEPTPRDRFAFLPARMRGEEGQPLRLAAAAVLLLLLGVFGWVFSRTRSNSRSGQAVHAASAQAVPALMAASTLPDSAKTDPGTGKPASTISLTLVPKTASDVMAKDVVQRAARSTVTERGSIPVKIAAPSGPATPNTVAEADVTPPDPSEALTSMKDGAAPVPQSIANPQPIFPFVALPVSQGVTGGRLTRKVDPTYPKEARVQHIEGTVMLDALVGEDGNVHEVTVTSGTPLLAKAAAQAVKQWRYQPFQLNGKPVSIHNQITIQFKLP
ncbi:MAG TPA: TonB family protein [Terriglobales bacterium]|nr:TonB family protein [Terriglobales bacterium]